MKVLMFIGLLLASSAYGQEIVYQGKKILLKYLSPVRNFEEEVPKEGYALPASRLMYIGEKTTNILLIHPLTAILFENIEERVFNLLNDDYFWQHVGTMDEVRGFIKTLDTIRWKMIRDRELDEDMGQYYRSQPILDKTMDKWTNGGKTNITLQEHQEQAAKEIREITTQ